jgi:CAAX protease family protein
MPFASLASGILILILCATMGAYAFAGLRDAKPVAYLEALAVAAGTAGLALAWTQWLAGHYPGLPDPLTEMRQTIGLGWSLFVIGLCPAIFEELAFRGLLQGRLMALLGRNTGILVTAVAFALAHGATLGLPFHFFLGLYLGFLRERTGSLYPGMLLHLVYNSTLVVLVF